ncbi:MAG: hypothetical protein M1813_002390 [Trichoglossum hirsutum]|nr:MAG: hypothetical protein M1813_002390 [Trichoglossum hirsutum]
MSRALEGKHFCGGGGRIVLVFSAPAFHRALNLPGHPGVSSNLRVKTGTPPELRVRDGEMTVVLDRNTPLRALNTTMPRKRSAHTVEIESKVEKAIEALKSKKAKSPYAAAKLFDLSLNTLTRRLNGGLTYSQSRESAQLLSKAEEDALAL